MQSCATVTRGTSEDYVIETIPSGAKVSGWTNSRTCTSPCPIEVKRKGSLALTIEKEGYETVKRMVHSSPNTLGNLAVVGNVIIGFGVHQGPVDGAAVCRIFNEVISGTDSPHYLSSDNDPLFRFHRWQANLRVLDITEIKSVPYVPRSHPFIERIIGTIRRDYLDQVPFWKSLDLERKLRGFKGYYNNHRTHAALSGQSPAKYSQQSPGSLADINNYTWRQHCRGLFQTPIPA